MQPHTIKGICIEIIKGGIVMKNVFECSINNQIGFQMVNGDTGVSKTISYTAHEIEYNNMQYHILYDSKMKPIESSFEFLNYYLSDRSENTKRKAAHALKLLFSYEDIINKELRGLQQADVNNLKRFLHGYNTPGNNLNIIMTSSRSNSTVNAYLSVYRQYLSFMGEVNTALSRRVTNHNYFDAYKESSYPVNEYVSNEKTANPIEVPKYISVENFKKVIEVIRSEFSVREEIIVRLMYQCGLRIGETMGLTFEDLDIVDEGGKYICLAYIRNRLSDKPYQLAKTCMSITDKKQYQQRDYQMRDVGFQVVIIPLDLYDLINDYINEYHSKARTNHRDSYFKATRADSTTNGYNEENFYIFINSLGRPLSQANWNQTMRKVFKKTGIHLDANERKHNLNHRFRHGFAMFNVQHLNLNEFELKQRMRHRSMQSVASYFNPTIKDQIALKNEFVDSLYDLYPELKLGGSQVE